MKKFFLISLLFISMFLNSCETDQEPTAMQATQQAAVVLSDAGSIILNTTTTAAGTIGSDDPVQAFYQSIVPLIQSTISSLFSFRAANSSQLYDLSRTHASPDLPSIYKVIGNPYEDYGFLHNRFLNTIYNSGGIDSFQNKLSLRDSATIMSLINEIPSLTNNQERLSVYNQIDTSYLYDSTITYLQSRSQQVVTFSSIWSEFQSLTTVQTSNNVDSVFKQYTRMVENRSSTSEIIDYVNTKIETVLARNEVLTSNDIVELKVYTVLKNSHYFWSTK